MMNIVGHVVVRARGCAGCEADVDGKDDLVELRELLTDGVARTGLTKNQLAAKTGLSRTTIHEALQDGGKVPSATTVAALAKALKMPDAQLLKLRRNAIGAGQTPGPGIASGRPAPNGAGSGLTPLAPPPAVPSGFTGRDEDLEDLLELLAPAPDAESGTDLGVGAVVVASVLGMGGMGKTTLCLAVAKAALARGLFTGVLFLDLYGYDETPVDGPGALDTALRALDTDPERIPPGTGQRAGLYRTQLAARASAGERVLVLADNASSSEQVEFLLPDGDGPHRMLVTSRDNLASDLGARLVDLDVLTPDNAIALMDTALRTVRRGDDRVTADPVGAARVAELCGYLPLALRIAAAQLGRTLKPAQLAKDLEDLGERLEVLEGSKDAVRTVLAGSYRRLPVPQAELFRLLAVNPGPDISTETAAALTGIGKTRDVRKRLEALSDASLIRQDPDTERWRMHDLVRAYAAEQAAKYPAHTDAALRRLLDYYTDTAHDAEAHLNPIAHQVGLGQRFSNRAQALAWLDVEHANLVAAIHAAHSAGHHQTARHLASHIGAYLSQRRLLQDRLDTAQTALAAARESHNLFGEANAWDTLGIALRSMGSYDEAEKAHRTALTQYQDLSDQNGEASAWNNLGSVLENMGRYDEAEKAHRTALTQYQDLSDENGEASAWNNLAIVLENMERYDEAEKAQRTALTQYQETGDQNGEASAWNNLAIVLASMRRYDEAEKSYRTALTQYQDLSDRSGEASAWNNLAIVLTRMRRYDEAEEAFRVSLTQYQDLGDQRLEASTWHHRSVMLREANKLNQAVTAGEQAVALFENLADHYQLGEASDKLADTLLAARRQKAEVRAMREKSAAAYRAAGADDRANNSLEKADE
ncbi:ATP-binding protein [Kitasatospora sp. NPDC051853]|uniref:ATP-binding protein n=1 Tax=Kitasatospora sp. NPDC051853 TaxID=3364058 RepID=UPI00379A8025